MESFDSEVTRNLSLCHPRKVVDSNNNVKETINYYPFGSEMKMQDPAQMAGGTWQPYRFTSKELDKQNGLNWYDFGARLFDVAGVPMWTSVDPLAEKYYPFTPYSYCAGDPVNKFDPDGKQTSPVYNREGEFMGTDDKGLQGVPIVMENSDFKQGMSHEEALSKDCDINSFASDEAFEKFSSHFQSLPNRPDYDGYLTLKEANDWYRNGNGESLYTDLNKIDLSYIWSAGDKYVGQEKIVNLLSNSASLNDGLVYGNIRLKRYPNNSVRAYSDIYDFDMKSWKNPLNWIRNGLTVVGKEVAGEGMPYEINIYGSKTLKTK